MSDVLTSGPFSTRIQHETILLSRGEDGGTLKLTPGEGESACSLIALAQQCQSMKPLPPNLKKFPFQVNFSADGLELMRQAEPRQTVQFGFAEGEDLINAIRMAVAKHIDQLRISGGPKRGGYTGSGHDPIIHGRD